MRIGVTWNEVTIVFNSKLFHLWDRRSQPTTGVFPLNALMPEVILKNRCALSKVVYICIDITECQKYVQSHINTNS